MIFNVKITETLEKIVTIQAKDDKEALQLADNKYRAASQDFVLDADDFTDVEFQVVE